MLRTSRRTVLMLAGSSIAFPVKSYAQTSEPIRIGVIGALTGTFASNGLAVDYGLQTAVKEVNNAGGVLGRKIELIRRDSAGDPARAVSAVKELIYNQNVDVVMGPVNSGEALPTVAVVADAKKLQFLLGVVDETIDPAKRPLGFRLSNTNTQWITNSVNYAVKSLKKAKIAVLNDTSGYGTLALSTLQRVMTEQGVKPVYTVLIDPNKADITDELVKAKAAGADVLQVWSNATGLLARLINARGEQAWDVPMVAHPTTLGEEVKRLVSKPSYLHGVFSPSYSCAVLDSSGELPEATRAYLKAHQPEVDQYLGGGVFAPLQGDAELRVYLAAVRKAGSIAPDAIRAALETIGEISTPFASFKYSPSDHNGFLDSGMQLVAADSAKGLGYAPAPAG
jgi:branched-chain amino acid transport system substrate-binding protein